jgi:hypothetical protein
MTEDTILIQNAIGEKVSFFLVKQVSAWSY